MNYVRTIISFEEDEYYALKHEAVKNRQSLSSLVREKVKVSKKANSGDVEAILAETERLARRNAKSLKGLSGVEIIREMRDNAKW